MNRPKIICLCGSTRFKSEFERVNKELTLAGNIVLSVGWFGHAEGGNKEDLIGSDAAAAQDELHKRKIDLADEIFVINVGGYIGESTRTEIHYAVEHNKPITWLER